MSGFTGIDDIVSKVTKLGQGNTFYSNKASPGSGTAAGTWMSYWYATGMPGAGSDPAATPGTVYDNADGSIWFADQVNFTRHLLASTWSASQVMTLVIYDRLVAVSGLSLASTGNKTVSSSALTRYTTGEQVQAWLEITTATTVTAPVVSMNSYTNQAGTAARAGPTVTFPAAATVVRAMVPLPVQVGDYGVRACSTINVATAASAGVCNFVLMRPLALLPINVADGGFALNHVLDTLNLDRVYDGHTIAVAALVSTTTGATIAGMLSAGHG